MSTYKLTYFKGKGRAEVCRQILAAADQPFDDVRLEREKWMELKPNTPFGQLPLLEFDDTLLAQSNAMARLLAKRFDLAGKTDVEQAVADMIVDSNEDMARPLLAATFEPDEAKKAEMKKKFVADVLPKYLENMEKLLKSNGGGDGYLVGDGLTWADIHFAHCASWLKDADWSHFPKLKALAQRVEAYPGIAQWIKKRPESQF